MISALVMSVVIGLAFYEFGLTEKIRELGTQIAPIVIGSFALFVTLLAYLRTSTYKIRSERIEELESLSKGFESIQSKVEQSIETKAGLTPEEKSQLLEYLRKQLTTESAQSVLNEIRQQHEKTLSKLETIAGVERLFSESKERLADEVDALGRRSNLNLVIGIMTAFAGLGVMAYVVFSNANTGSDKEWIAMASHYIPRTSLVIFVEVFAYFFLRLYKVNLGEIKFFQNELTNLELKYAALRTALIIDDQSLRSKVICELAKTERNFVLKKGESTVEIEARKTDKDYVVELAAAVADAVGKSKKG